MVQSSSKYVPEFRNIWIDEMSTMTKSIKWIRTARRCSLSARVEVQPRGWEVGISEADMLPIHEWCLKNHCGKRVSFDTFQFKNKKEMTLFLLRWS